MTFEDFAPQPSGSTPIGALEGWFGAHGWAHERIGDEEIIATTPGAWGTYELRAICREDDRVLQFLAFPDVVANQNQFAGIYETVGLVNEQLWLGHFELWSANGTIVYRNALLLEDDEGPNSTQDQIEGVIDFAIGELDRFYPVFQFVLWGGKSPSEAISAAMVETQGEA